MVGFYFGISIHKSSHLIRSHFLPIFYERTKVYLKLKWLLTLPIPLHLPFHSHKMSCWTTSHLPVQVEWSPSPQKVRLTRDHRYTNILRSEENSHAYYWANARDVVKMAFPMRCSTASSETRSTTKSVPPMAVGG